MHRKKIIEMFDALANVYDEQWAKMAPISSALHLQMAGVLALLPEDANILCVGAGTGAEILYLGSKFPHWQFTAVEPSMAMMEVCQARLREANMENRCTFHCGYLESVTTTTRFDASTAILVSQFIMERNARAAFFSLIKTLLKPKGILISADLSANQNSSEYKALLEAWVEMMHSAGIPFANLEKMRETYQNDVAILSEKDITDIITAGGFQTPIPFFQSLLIHAWFSKKA